LFCLSAFGDKQLDQVDNKIFLKNLLKSLATPAMKGTLDAIAKDKALARLFGEGKMTKVEKVRRISRSTVQQAKSTSSKRSLKYFEVPRPSGDGFCSDNACPCPEVRIPRGTGYLYVSREVVDFRRDARSVEEAHVKLNLLQLQMPRVMFIGGSTAILMCKRGAKLRGLDLDVAAADAKYWWETGLAPLRATPTVGSTKNKPKKVKCVRCGKLETKAKATHLAQGWVCGKCDRELTQEVMRDMMGL
jgi:ribosomal protein S27AE